MIHVPPTPVSRRRPGGAARWLMTLALIGLLGLGSGVPARGEVLPLDDFSPGFLGMYRKVMEIEGDILRYAQRYGVDFDLARAVCLYESGGNEGLASGAGARGYFQVMPLTFRSLGVETNIEAGVKYLAMMIRQFGKEDRAVAAYNAGPGTVGRSGRLPLETLQYVVGVGHYRTVLKLHDESLRHHAGLLRLARVGRGEDWAALERRLGIPAWELRLHNPFLSSRPLREGSQIAYPQMSRPNLLSLNAEGGEYRMRTGDNYLKLAFTLGLDVDGLRTVNNLWQIQDLPAGAVLRIPFAVARGEAIRDALVALGADLRSADVQYASFTPDGAGDRSDIDDVAVALAEEAADEDAEEEAIDEPPAPVFHTVRRGETLSAVAERYGVSVGAIQSANNLRRRNLIQVGQRLEIPGATGDSALSTVTYRVRRGDTLIEIANRFGVSVDDIQRASGLGRQNLIRVGQYLTIPGGSPEI
ncbi:MAG: LysM peptidoglycan-binding domain-containing protein [Acidimicrobiia bacterium]|nr:LysM peptidoglycan-binding domain-containing protein [Acidimicrobiia bacterium]